VRTILSRGMKSDLARRKREDKPAMAGIHGLESEYIAKKGSVGFGVLAVDDYVRARDHAVHQSEDAEILA
jgi:hypothetical protein